MDWLTYVSFIPAAIASLIFFKCICCHCNNRYTHSFFYPDSKTILNKMQVYCPVVEDKTLPFEFQSPLSVLLLSAAYHNLQPNFSMYLGVYEMDLYLVVYEYPHK